jgi:hypothetical protein
MDFSLFDFFPHLFFPSSLLASLAHTRFVLNGTPGFFLAFFSFSAGFFSNRAKWNLY